MTVKKEKLFIWAVDPFSKDKSLQRSTAIALRTLARKISAQVRPVYIWSSPAILAPMGGPLEYRPEMRVSGQKELDKTVRGLRLSNLQPLVVLVQPALTLHQQIEQLVAYAKDEQAELIATSTRARRGPARWILGSFTESLMFYSDVPLFVINPFWNRLNRFNRILFPTDFSDESKKAFKKVLEFAQDLKSNVMIYTKFFPEIDLPPDITIGIVPIVKEMIQDQIQKRRSEAEKLTAEGKEAGVRCDVEIDTEVTDSVADSILKRTEKGSGIIALAAHSEPNPLLAVGSTTRQVVRGSHIPVWVIHPHIETKKSSRKITGKAA